MKQEFEAIEATTFFGRNNFSHIEAMNMISFSKYSKFYVDLENAIKFQKNLMSLEIIAFDVKPFISINYNKNASEWPSTC